MTSPPTKGKKRGSILLLALFFMFILFLLAVTLFNLVPTDLHAASRSREDLMGHYVSNAGVQEAIAWLSQSMNSFQTNQNPDDVPDAGSNIANWNAQFNDTPTKLSSAWSWTCNITPDTVMNTGNAAFEPHVYYIQSTAYFWGKAYRKAYVTVKQASFAGYAMFIDQWPQDGTFWALGSGGVNGPVHTNNYLVLKAPDAYFANDANPYFWGPRSEVTFSQPFGTGGDGLAYLGGNANPNAGGLPTPMATPDYNFVPYTQSGNTDRYYAMLSKGRQSLQQKNVVDLPTNVAALPQQAWDARTNGTAVPTLSKGVYVNNVPVTGGKGAVVGGVYIQGDAQSMDMGLDSSGNQVMKVTQQIPVTTTQTYQKTVGYTQVPYNPPRYQQVPTGYKTETGSWTQQVADGYKTVTTTYQQPVYKTVTVYETVGGISTPVQQTVVDHYETKTKTQQVATGYHTVVHTYTYQVPTGYANGAELYQQVPVTTTATKQVTSNVAETTTIYEVTSDNQITVRDSSGNSHTASKGQTVVEDPQGNVTVYNGLLNGTIFDNGNINSLQGIVKGSASVDGGGNLTYHNKTIAVNNDKLANGSTQQIDITGDLLQFSQQAFDSLSGGAKASFDTYDKYATIDAAHWKGAALNPDDAHQGDNWSPDTSPNSDNALGLIGHDVYIKGRSDWGNPIDVYGVILAGQTLTDQNGNKIGSSGGFGTYPSYLSGGVGGAGHWRIIGGIIQAQPHPWVTANGGDIGSLWYDDQASKQSFFPTYPNFNILRYVEVPANGD